MFDNCKIDLRDPSDECHFHNKIRFEFLNWEFKSDADTEKEIIDFQMRLFQNMDCYKNNNFELYISNDTTNESLEIISKPEPNQYQDDSKNNQISKDPDQSYSWYQSHGSDLLKSSKGIKNQKDCEELIPNSIPNYEEEKINNVDSIDCSNFDQTNVYLI